MIKNSNTSELIVDWKKDFKWKTMKGEILTLDEMKNSHIFNCFKMIYNHIAEKYKLPTVWFMQKYKDYKIKAVTIPKKLMMTMCIFIKEIEERGDLPEKYILPYSCIIDSLMKAFNLENWFDPSIGDRLRLLEYLKKEAI